MIETVIASDLHDRGASSRLKMKAHNVAQRLTPVPNVKVTDAGFLDDREKINSLQATLAAMRKTYCQ
eukprot:12415726-Karenia_brevis.AAC.1